MRFFASLRMTDVYRDRKGGGVVGGAASNHHLPPYLKTQVSVILSETK